VNIRARSLYTRFLYTRVDVFFIALSHTPSSIHIHAYTFTLTPTHAHTRTQTHKACLHSRNFLFVCSLITNFLRHNCCITIFRTTKEFHSTIHLFLITPLCTTIPYNSSFTKKNNLERVLFSHIHDVFVCVRITCSCGHMAPLFFPHPFFFLFLFCMSTWPHYIFVCVRVTCSSSQGSGVVMGLWGGARGALGARVEVGARERIVCMKYACARWSLLRRRQRWQTCVCIQIVHIFRSVCIQIVHVSESVCIPTVHVFIYSLHSSPKMADMHLYTNSTHI